MLELDPISSFHIIFWRTLLVSSSYTSFLWNSFIFKARFICQVLIQFPASYWYKSMLFSTSFSGGMQWSISSINVVKDCLGLFKDCWDCLKIVGIVQRLLGLSKDCWDCPKIVGIVQRLLGLSKDCWDCPKIVGIVQRLLGLSKDCWDCPKFLEITQSCPTIVVGIVLWLLGLSKDCSHCLALSNDSWQWHCLKIVVFAIVQKLLTLSKDFLKIVRIV